MTRLGFDDSAPIESGMVTGAITQAQIKVETRNFDIRKRALEFDDVLNNQRNVIYDQRKTILELGDVRETVLDFLHDEVATLVDEHASGSEPEEWDLDALAAGLRAILGIGDDFTKAAFDGVDSQEALAAKVDELVDETYDAREKAFGPELMRAVERWVLLRMIDTHWTEHLTAMEELREGIYLRGYGQQDPLVAYKSEAHTFFEQMTGRIATGVAQAILRVTVKTAEQAEAEEKQKAAGQPAADANRELSSGRASPADPNRPGSAAAPTRPAKLPGRNEPCFCGSGKKYKKCHGR